MRYNGSETHAQEIVLTNHHFPHTLYLVHHLPTNSYGCVYAESVRGLACFTQADGARRFARRMETRRNLIVEMSMADACEAAAQARVPALVLADDEDAPIVYPLLGKKSLS